MNCLSCPGKRGESTFSSEILDIIIIDTMQRMKLIPTIHEVRIRVRGRDRGRVKGRVSGRVKGRVKGCVNGVGRVCSEDYNWIRETMYK